MTPTLQNVRLQHLIADLPWCTPGCGAMPDVDSAAGAVAWRQRAEALAGSGREWWEGTFTAIEKTLRQPTRQGGLTQGDAGLLAEWCAGIRAQLLPATADGVSYANWIASSPHAAVLRVLDALREALTARYHGHDLMSTPRGSLGQSWWEERS